MALFQKIEKYLSKIDENTISESRKQKLQELVQYIQYKIDNKEFIQLNFICTHNSRRSHFAQIWAQTLAHYFQIENINCYSGGTEATAMYKTVVESLQEVGFQIKKTSENKNPVFKVSFNQTDEAIICFSKKHNDNLNPKINFAAIMTCSDADENCPIISGAEKRIAITYEDPKAFDNTNQALEKYNERSFQIASELFYVFSEIN